MLAVEAGEHRQGAAQLHLLDQHRVRGRIGRGEALEQVGAELIEAHGQLLESGSSSDRGGDATAIR
jgi:hypothetical protein